MLKKIFKIKKVIITKKKFFFKFFNKLLLKKYIKIQTKIFTMPYPLKNSNNLYQNSFFKEKAKKKMFK